MSVDEARIEVLQAEAKLKVKAARAIFRQKLELVGNVFLESFLWAMILLVVWYVAWLVLWQTPSAAAWWYAPLGISKELLAKLNVIALVCWKAASMFLLLIPGIACRTVASAMRE